MYGLWIERFDGKTGYFVMFFVPKDGRYAPTSALWGGALEILKKLHKYGIDIDRFVILLAYHVDSQARAEGFGCESEKLNKKRLYVTKWYVISKISIESLKKQIKYFMNEEGVIGDLLTFHNLALLYLV